MEPKTVVQAPAQKQPFGKPLIVPAPVVKAEPVKAPDATPMPAADILKRVNAEPLPKAPDAQIPDADRVFSSADLKSELEKIQDPAQRKMFEDVYGNMEKGLSKKMRELGNKISEYDNKLKQATTWTPERLKNEINRQDFLQSAQTVMQSQQTPPPSNWDGSNQAWSVLTPAEQQHLRGLEHRIVETQNEIRGQQEQLTVERADQEIKQRIPNYDPGEVNNLQQRFLRREIPLSQIREMLWKAQNFEKVVQQTYQLALQDKAGTLQEKLQASSYTGGTTNTQSDTPVRLEKETPSSFFKRLAEHRLKESRQAK